MAGIDFNSRPDGQMPFLLLTNPSTFFTMAKSSTISRNSFPIRMKMEKNYWLLKTEPGEWSWEDQAVNGGISKWDGVKNKQAQKNLRSMRLDDLCFFYHSGSKFRRVVGVVSVVRQWYDDDDGDGAVDVKAVAEMRRPVDLKEMKGDDGLKKDFALFRQPRLSVVPVPEIVWNRICELGGGYGEDHDSDDDEDEGVNCQ